METIASEDPAKEFRADATWYFWFIVAVAIEGAFIFVWFLLQMLFGLVAELIVEFIARSLGVTRYQPDPVEQIVFFLSRVLFAVTTFSAVLAYTVQKFVPKVRQAVAEIRHIFD